MPSIDVANSKPSSAPSLWANFLNEQNRSLGPKSSARRIARARRYPSSQLRSPLRATARSAVSRATALKSPTLDVWLGRSSTARGNRNYCCRANASRHFSDPATSGNPLSWRVLQAQHSVHLPSIQPNIARHSPSSIGHPLYWPNTPLMQNPNQSWPVSSQYQICLGKSLSPS